MEEVLAGLRAEHGRIAGLLETAQTAAERDAVKREIIAYYKRVDGLLVDLGEAKEQIRALVERFKELAQAGEASSAPALSEAGPAPLHADHLGASTFIEKGWSLLSLGDFPGAIQALERALTLAPGDIKAESLVGWAQMLSEQYDEALQTFQKVLRKEPANALARINVGYICLKKRIFGEAIEHLSKAIRLANDPKATLYANYYLGLVYLEREMFEDAQTFFKKALHLGPNLLEAAYELGRSQWFAGSREEATATWSAAYQSNRFNPWAKRCKELLEAAAAGGEIPRR